MKTLALTSTVFVLSAAGAMAQQSDIEFLRARADAHERKISQLERELNQLKADYAKKEHPKAVPVPAEQSAVASEYTVKKGDVLVRIAKQFNVSVAAVKAANGLKNDHIRIGQKLHIPGVAQEKAPAVAAESKKPLPPTPQAEPLQKKSTYVVKSGDTFYSIARQHQVSVASLMAANPSVTPKSLQVGRKLKIDGSARAPKTPKNVAKANKPQPKSKKSTKLAKQTNSPKPKQSKKEVTRKTSNEAKTVSTREPEIRTVIVHKQITYGQFANKYGASTNQLNELNGLSLSKNTMLAVGSELYVPRD